MVCLVQPLIEEQGTRLQKSTSAAERLAMNLRYIATGDSYASFMNLFVHLIHIHNIQVFEVPYVIFADYTFPIKSYFLKGYAFQNLDSNQRILLKKKLLLRFWRIVFFTIF